MELQYLRKVYLGESIAPFRILGSAEGVIPITDEGDAIGAAQANDLGFLRLAAWLSQAEATWAEHSVGRLTLGQRWDYHRELSIQFPLDAIRVVFSKAGTRPAASLIGEDGVVDHKLYWAAVNTRQEGLYLLAILNSETARARIADMQSRGEQGARDFDKLIFTLPIPLFDHRDVTHIALATAGQEAETVAGSVAIPPGATFQRARALVRRALLEDGVAARIDDLVETLLGPVRPVPIDGVRHVPVDEAEPAEA